MLEIIISRNYQITLTYVSIVDSYVVKPLRINFSQNDFFWYTIEALYMSSVYEISVRTNRLASIELECFVKQMKVEHFRYGATRIGYTYGMEG